MTLRRIWPVLALAALLSLAHALATPAFWPVDETSHVAYADHLMAEGSLPVIDTPINDDLPYPGLNQRLIWERDQDREGRQDIWTSNHPPLPYLVQGAALRVGFVLAGGDGALMLARLTSTAWLLAGVWLTMRLAHLLAPRPRAQTSPTPRSEGSGPHGDHRPRSEGSGPDGDHGPRSEGLGEGMATATAGGGAGLRTITPDGVAYAAGAIVGTTPTLSHLGGVTFNDTAAFALSTACLLVGVLIAMRGVDMRRLLLLGAVCGAAAITRVSCLPAVGVAVLLLGYGGWRHGVAIPRQRWALALVGATAPMLPAAAFWLRNLTLYGDVSASAELLDKFDRGLNAPVAVLVTDREFWLRLWDRMLGDLTTGHWAIGTRAAITQALLLVVLAAVVVTMWRLDITGGPRQWLANPRAVSWAACLLLPAVLLVSTIQFHSAGGSLHGRYMLGGHAVVATALVVLLAQLPRIGRVVGLLVPAVLLLVNGFLLQALTLHHSITWTRRSVSMVLPQLTGTAAESLVSACIAVAAGLLAVSIVQHLPVRRRSGHPPRADRHGVQPPSRAIKESAAA
ncbi:MAG TPA: hypothetical protein VMM13_09150 [Euzebya sp.]|nr:hypothetical protein [Euzebya sp.]